MKRIATVVLKRSLGVAGVHNRGCKHMFSGTVEGSTINQQPGNSYRQREFSR
jgi:hypothetical protein